MHYLSVSIQCTPTQCSTGIQCTPTQCSTGIQCTSTQRSIGIQCTSIQCSTGIQCTPTQCSTGIQCTPTQYSIGIQCTLDSKIPQSNSESVGMQCFQYTHSPVEVSCENFTIKQALMCEVLSCVEKQNHNPSDYTQYFRQFCNTKLTLSLEGETPIIQSSNFKKKSWKLNYQILSFLMCGQYFKDYSQVLGLLGQHQCAKRHWDHSIEWIAEHVRTLADWSCEQVRQVVVERGDQKSWVASYDGFYLTRGHHSNNSSATLHDHKTGQIAWYEHRTKRGKGHNWSGTSNGAEGNILNSILQEVSSKGFEIINIVMDHDVSSSAIFCQHFPEGRITYCGNHTAKTLYNDLKKVKAAPCKVGIYTQALIAVI